MAVKPFKLQQMTLTNGGDNTFQLPEGYSAKHCMIVLNGMIKEEELDYQVMQDNKISIPALDDEHPNRVRAIAVLDAV